MKIINYKIYGYFFITLILLFHLTSKMGKNDNDLNGRINHNNALVNANFNSFFKVDSLNHLFTKEVLENLTKKELKNSQLFSNQNQVNENINKEQNSVFKLLLLIIATQDSLKNEIKQLKIQVKDYEYENKIAEQNSN